MPDLRLDQHVGAHAVAPAGREREGRHHGRAEAGLDHRDQRAEEVERRALRVGPADGGQVLVDHLLYRVARRAARQARPRAGPTRARCRWAGGSPAATIASTSRRSASKRRRLTCGCASRNVVNTCGQQVRGHQRRGRDAQGLARLVALGAELRGHVVQVGDQPLHHRQQPAPGRREADHARGAVEEAAAQLLFHLADQDAQPRLRDVGLLGRAREVAQPRHLQEGAHLAGREVHKDS
jgi:hypothetical protein